jgi:hypothetical protein
VVTHPARAGQQMRTVLCVPSAARERALLRVWPGVAAQISVRLSLSAFPARMLDDCVRAGEYQGGVIVLESHEVRRFAARSADLDDLACPLRLAHDAATHVKPVSDGCLHAPPP